MKCLVIPKIHDKAAVAPKYYSFDKMAVNSVYSTAPQYTDTDSVMISGGDKHE